MLARGLTILSDWIAILMPTERFGNPAIRAWLATRPAVETEELLLVIAGKVMELPWIVPVFKVADTQVHVVTIHRRWSSGWSHAVDHKMSGGWSNKECHNCKKHCKRVVAPASLKSQLMLMPRESTKAHRSLPRCHISVTFFRMATGWMIWDLR